MTIDQLYRFVKLMANKENRGWIKPSEFDLLAQRAQLDIIKDRVGVVSPDGVINGYKANAQFWDELRPVIGYNQAIYNDGDGDFKLDASDNNIFEEPEGDYLYFLSAKFAGKSVDMVDVNELEIRRESHLNPPTDDFPIGVISNEGVRIFIGSDSEDSGVLRMTYIKRPSIPKWGYSTVNNIEVYNAGTSTQLSLPESTHKEIAHRILAYIGVTLRESTVVEYGTATVVEQNK
jgi:hypothetical protein